MSKFLIACGGTGGHLAPGIALAEEMRGRGFDSLLLISRKTIDRQLTEKYPQHRFESVPGVPLLFSAAGVLRFGVSQIRGLVHAWRLIRRERPTMIVGFGGFTTAAVIVAGWMLRVPVALHESNRVPGRAVRLMARKSAAATRASPSSASPKPSAGSSATSNAARRLRVNPFTRVNWPPT